MAHAGHHCSSQGTQSSGTPQAGKKQMVVVTDHDSKVIARRTFQYRACDLGSALDWAAGRAVWPQFCFCSYSFWTGSKNFSL
jgi:hypothetical protein